MLRHAFTIMVPVAFIAAPVVAQTTTAPTSAPTSPAMSSQPTAATDGSAPALTEKEQATLTKCKAMLPAQQAQSSKCSKVMVKAGMADPAKAAMSPSSSGN